MAFSYFTSTSLSLLLLLLLSFAYPALSQQQAPPTIASCGSLFLSLVPCAPFVQGTADSPTQPCCNSLNQLYAQQPDCLCLLLNNTSIFSSFPINTTLATKLPVLCSLQADNNTIICSGVAEPATASPPAQIPLETHSNATTGVSPASPARTMTPRTSILGYRHSEGIKLKIKSHLVVLITAFIYM